MANASAVLTKTEPEYLEVIVALAKRTVFIMEYMLEANTTKLIYGCP